VKVIPSVRQGLLRVSWGDKRVLEPWHLPLQVFYRVGCTRRMFIWANYTRPFCSLL